MDYKKKSLNKIDVKSDYEEIDTRLASGWYVDSVGTSNKKKYKTKEVQFKIAKKSCLLYTSPSPRDRSLSRMPSSA